MPELKLAADVVELKNQSSLKIKYDCGLDDNQKVITRTRSYSNVKASAKPLDVFNVAETLISLQKHDKLSVMKQDNTELAL